jgi:hypothetical protein
MEKENEKIKEKAIDKDCYTKPQERKKNVIPNF